MPRDRSFLLLLLCFFLSGLAALVYETAWTREFAFVFGTSELAVATVLAAYMGGLAAGAAVAGRFARRITRPVLAYGVLELAIAVAALAVPLGVAASRWLYVAIFGGQDALPDAGGLETSLFYLVCSFGILLVPTAMMGATLPLLARHAVRETSQIGGRVGVLYATNTAGAVCGVLLGSFVLLPELGLRATIVAAAGINALVFGAAWALARSSPPLPEAPPEKRVAAPMGRAAWILPLVGFSGFASFTYEVLWVRLLGHVVGAGVQAFGTMLASFLAGIAIGAAVASRFATTRERSALGFGLAQLGVAALSFVAFATIDSITTLPLLSTQSDAAAWGRVLACMATLFPAALCIGATFPFAVRVLARDGDDAGPASARVYAVNTIGSILGSIAAGFWIVPELGFPGALALCVALNLLLAAGAAALATRGRIVLASGAAVGGVLLALAPPQMPWQTLRASSMREGVVQHWGRVRYFAVGRSSTVLVTDQHTGFALRNNGLPEAGMQRPGTWINRHPVTRWLGSLPVLARPDAKSMLLVGLGGGMAIEIVPETIERIDVIELEPEVVAANRDVAEERWRDPLSDPRVHVHTNDARNALLLASGARFDAIVSQPSHPWAGGAAHLYTQEFFELVRERLTPDGVFVQWIGLPFVDEALFRSLLATLAHVFPHVQVFDPPPGGSILFIASAEPLAIHPSAQRALERVADDLALIGIRTPEDALASLVIDDAGVRELAEGAPRNRDRHNRLQNRSHRLPRHRSLAVHGERLFARVDPLVGAVPEDADLFRLLRTVPARRAERIAGALEDGIDREVGLALAEIGHRKRVSARRRLEDVLEREPRHPEARAAWMRLRVRQFERGEPVDDVLEPPLSDAERALAAAWQARAADRSGEARLALDAELAAVPTGHPLAIEAQRLRIQARLASDDPERLAEAIALAEEGLGARPRVQDLLLRAEAYAANGQALGTLETVRLLLGVTNQRVRSHRPLRLRAQQLLRQLPRDPELQALRRHVEQRL